MLRDAGFDGTTQVVASKADVIDKCHRLVSVGLVTTDANTSIGSDEEEAG